MDKADAIAEVIGIYFDGCDLGKDCDCCGDRWGRAWSDDATDSPMWYDEPLVRCDEDKPFAYIHPLVGNFYPAKKDK